jgi:dihydrofolate reductase
MNLQSRWTIFPKLYFPAPLKEVDWKTAKLAKRDLKEEISELKQSRCIGSKDILVGSPSLIVALTQLGLIDEYQLGVQPTIVGSGLPLFKNVTERINLKLFKTKTFGCGAVFFYYASTGQNRER